MPPFDVIVNPHSVLEILVTSRAMIGSIKTKMDLTHVSFHLGHIRTKAFSTNQADQTTVTSLNLALHQVIHSKVL